MVFSKHILSQCVETAYRESLMVLISKVKTMLKQGDMTNFCLQGVGVIESSKIKSRLSG